MTRTPPTNLRSLEARLRNLARAEELAEGRVRRALSVAIVGQLLRHSRAGVIKGASNLELRLGTEFSRASSDLDAVRFVELDDFRSRLEEALVTGWQGFTGRMIDRGEVGAPVPTAYWPHRFHAKLDFQGRPFSTVELEVASEEVGGLTVHELIDLDPVTAAWFDVLGFEVPGPIPVLPLAHQIAQKLHACTTPDDIGWTNERAHDLIDLQLAVELFAGELAEIRDVAVRLFPARQRQPWPPTVTVGVLVQANYGVRSQLRIAGVPVGREITDLMPETRSPGDRPDGDGSIIVVATDAPVLPHQLKRIAKRASL